MKRSCVFIMFILIISLLSGCTGKAASGDKPIPSSAIPSAAAAPSGEAQENDGDAGKISAESLGIKMPASFGIMLVKPGSGLYVYGSGKVKANQKQFKAEIDRGDLKKIKAGDSVKLTNAEKNVACSGTVISIPGADKTLKDDICYIDIGLEDKAAAAASQSNSNEGNGQSGGGKITVAAGGGLPTVDADVEVKICLPAASDSISIPNKCIFTGKDGNSYVWSTEKGQKEATIKDFKLTKVVLGETDGRCTIITSGLKAGGSVLLGL